jgi:hypothetical protein
MFLLLMLCNLRVNDSMILEGILMRKNRKEEKRKENKRKEKKRKEKKRKEE